MKEIRNVTARPIRVPLPGGKTLFVGPAKVAQIADKATEHAGLQKLVTEGSIEILGEGEQVTGAEKRGVAREKTSGGPKSFRRGTGDR
ncbi:hypothetical protein DRQ53_08255 [bacterium]|nr:MAG: hypothetical protein DRQ32_11050 [bacterium]RKZ15713.1 MAG: hypothetical protein DRQ53_08255 [bacterium]